MTIKKDVRPFTDAEYAIIALQGFKRMVRRTDLYVGFIPPRSVLRDNAESVEVAAALEYAIEVMRQQLIEEDGE